MAGLTPKEVAELKQAGISAEEIARAEASADTAIAAMPPEERLAGDPEIEAQRQEVAETNAQLAADAQNSALERRLVSLEDQLRESNRKVAALMSEGHDNEAIAWITMGEERTRVRNERYRRIQKNGGYCTVQIAASDNPADNEPVRVTLNDDVVFVPRGVPCKLSAGHLSVLEQMEVRNVTKIIDDEGHPQVRRTMLPRVPLFVVDEHGRNPQAVMPKRMDARLASL